MRRLKQFARCHVQGHGRYCELNRELRQKPITRAQEKRTWKQREQPNIWMDD